MKMKEFGPRGASLAPPLGSANAIKLIKRTKIYQKSPVTVKEIDVLQNRSTYTLSSTQHKKSKCKLIIFKIELENFLYQLEINYSLVLQLRAYVKAFQLCEPTLGLMMFKHGETIAIPPDGGDHVKVRYIFDYSNCVALLNLKN